jgi:hypothetical protein
MDLRRRVLAAILAIGTIAGFACGFGSLHRRERQRMYDFERHVATVCTDAAQRAATK